MKRLALLFILGILPLWADTSLVSKSEYLHIKFDGSGSLVLTFQFNETLPLHLKKRFWDRISHAAEEAGLSRLDLNMTPPPQPPTATLNINFHHVNDLQKLLDAYKATGDSNNLDDKVLYPLFERLLATGTYNWESFTHMKIHRIISKPGPPDEATFFRLKVDLPFVTTDGKQEADGSFTWDNDECMDITIPWFIFIPRWIMGLIGGIITGSILSIIFIFIKKRVKRNKITPTLSQNDSNKEDKMAQVRQSDTWR